MSGFDKSMMYDVLKEHGWVEVSEGMLSSPKSLWENKPNTFNIYDATDLQDILVDTDKIAYALK